MPLYFKLLQPSGSVEILAHRIIWSLTLVALLLAGLRHWAFLRSLLRQPRTLLRAALAGALIALNWFTYIYGVNSDRVVETALGYFINPLVVVLLGVGVLRERLRTAQWVALGIGGLAVVVLTAGYGRLPYIALTLAFTFGCYGLIKKRLGLPAVEGLFVESAVLALPALGYFGWLVWHAESTFGHVSAGHTALMLLAGPATAIPLLLFAGAANRIPLTAIGILQYVTPVMQLCMGLVIFHEPMPPARLAGFALVWLALVIFTADAVRHTRQQIRRTVRSPASPSPEPTRVR
jgi:chloramphenicol-sensitive protein RarD